MKLSLEVSSDLLVDVFEDIKTKILSGKYNNSISDKFLLNIVNALISKKKEIFLTR